MITERESVRQVDGKVVLKVAAGSKAAKVAGALAIYLEEGNEDVSLIAMGAGAVNQAVKAICIARQMVASKGWNLYFIPGFKDQDVRGEQKTVIVFYVKK